MKKSDEDLNLDLKFDDIELGSLCIKQFDCSLDYEFIEVAFSILGFIRSLAL